MRKEFFLLIACAMLVIASIPTALCYPPAGSDYLDPTSAIIELEITDMFNETLVVMGPTNVSRSTPYDPGDGHIKIDTEIVSMNLVGMSTHIGPITIVESPSKKSNGTVRQQIAGQDFPADSFFDVYIEIQTMLGPPFSVLHNDDPAVMSATIDEIPPWNTTYIPPSTILIPLKDQNGAVIGFIKHIAHKIGPLIHDVAVTDITTSKTGCLPKETLGEGRPIDINVTIENQGESPESFTVRLWANGANDTLIAEFSVVNLAPGAGLLFSGEDEIVGGTKGSIRIMANATIVPGETDTADNTYIYGFIFKTLAGDVDGDRDVDIFDIVRMAGAYGGKRPDPRYNPNCDLDNDGDTDIFDIVIAAGNYGKSW